MEIIAILAILVTFAYLAARYGHDSRNTISNKEEEFVRHGYTWDTLQYEQKLAIEIEAARRERARLGNAVEAA
jgi:hypothetical protein